MKKRTKIAVIHPCYLGLTETFIHRTFMHLTRYEPIVLTKQILNSDTFRFSDYYKVIQTGNKKEPISRIVAKLLRTINHNNKRLYDEHVKLASYIIRNRVKIIHAQFGPVGWSTIPLSKTLNLPLIVSFHGADASLYVKDVDWLDRYRELFDSLDCLICPTQEMVNRLTNNGCPIEKTRIVRYGLDINEWPFPNVQLSMPNGIFTILMVARFVEKKGIPIALKAMSYISQNINPSRLLIIGDGPLKTEIETMIKAYQLKDRVFLLGNLPNHKVKEYMQHCDILISPSITASNGDKEGLPNVIIEAAAVGLPVIATDHAGIPEIIVDGKTGLLVKEGDVDSLVNCIVQIYSDMNLRNEIRLSARKKVEEEFNIVNSARHLEEIYDSLL